MVKDTAQFTVARSRGKEREGERGRDRETHTYTHICRWTDIQRQTHREIYIQTETDRYI